MNRRNPATDLALVAVFAALIAVVTVWVPGFTVPGIAVPITLQTMMVGLAAMVLGPWRGAAAAGLYLLMGLFGLPVFAQGASGFGVLGRPSAGYLLSFPIYGLVVGALAYWAIRRGLTQSTQLVRIGGLFVAGLIGSFLVVHPLGILGMARNGHLALSKAATVDLTFWPGDLLKTVVATVVALAVHKAFPWLALGQAEAPVAAEKVVAEPAVQH